MAELTSDQFLRQLRDALNHLYDLDHLRRNPLVAALGLADRRDAPSALQRTLTDAIESLRPLRQASSQSSAWRIYDLLVSCYLQQLEQLAVADQLGVSSRQLRRERRAALEALAQKLWQQLEPQAHGHRGEAAEAAAPDAVEGPDVDGELAWLRQASLDRPTDLAQTLLAVRDLTRPLAGRHGVSVAMEVGDALPQLAVHPVGLNQMLLNLLSTAIRRSSGHQVVISARSHDWEVEVSVEGPALPSISPCIAEEDGANLGMAYRMAELCGARIALSTDAQAFAATLSIPAAEQVPVLVIDDNADTVQLLQRYASVTRYRLIGLQDPKEALELAKKLAPHIIVLDVMMPQVDGWRVLESLRQHPLTGHIPIVVCTILAQEELAFSLGASGYVRKPVTRRAFLAALDQQLGQMEQEPG
jgi:CheY-like chemotaxis protein